MVLWKWGRVINLTDHRKFQFSVPLHSSRPNKHQSHNKWPNQRFNSWGDETTQSFNPGTAHTEGGPYWLLLPADQLSWQHHKVCVCACVCVCVPKPKAILSHRTFCIHYSSNNALTPRRYLDSCNIPNTVKRKCGSSSCTSTSDEDKQQEANGNKGIYDNYLKLLWVFR